MIQEWPLEDITYADYAKQRGITPVALTLRIRQWRRTLGTLPPREE